MFKALPGVGWYLLVAYYSAVKQQAARLLKGIFLSKTLAIRFGSTQACLGHVGNMPKHRCLPFPVLGVQRAA